MSQTCTVDEELFTEILLQCKKHKHKQFRKTFNKQDIITRMEVGLLKSDKWLEIENGSIFHVRDGVQRKLILLEESFEILSNAHNHLSKNNCFYGRKSMAQEIGKLTREQYYGLNQTIVGLFVDMCTCKYCIYDNNIGQIFDNLPKKESVEKDKIKEKN